mmetsp:Transcript_11329/g.39341  ORF Transcript_11329/g.39341 Transcript_11329/m.39341 type:complete len:425 (-) Transcript_11329:102-1376(-)
MSCASSPSSSRLSMDMPHLSSIISRKICTSHLVDFVHSASSLRPKEEDWSLASVWPTSLRIKGSTRSSSVLELSYADAMRSNVATILLESSSMKRAMPGAFCRCSTKASKASAGSRTGPPGVMALARYDGTRYDSALRRPRAATAAAMAGAPPSECRRTSWRFGRPRRELSMMSSPSPKDDRAEDWRLGRPGLGPRWSRPRSLAAQASKTSTECASTTPAAAPQSVSRAVDWPSKMWSSQDTPGGGGASGASAVDPSCVADSRCGESLEIRGSEASSFSSSKCGESSDRDVPLAENGAPKRETSSSELARRILAPKSGATRSTAGARWCGANSMASAGVASRSRMSDCIGKYRPRNSAMMWAHVTAYCRCCRARAPSTVSAHKARCTPGSEHLANTPPNVRKKRHTRGSFSRSGTAISTSTTLW